MLHLWIVLWTIAQDLTVHGSVTYIMSKWKSMHTDLTNANMYQYDIVFTFLVILYHHKTGKLLNACTTVQAKVNLHTHNVVDNLVTTY